MRRYNDGGFAGRVQLRRTREGARVGIYHAAQAGVDAGEPWAVSCEDHGTIAGHRTLGLARHHAVKPSNWCEHCRTALESNGKSGEERPPREPDKLCRCRRALRHRDCCYCGNGAEPNVCGACRFEGIDGHTIRGTGRVICAIHKKGAI